MQPSDDIEQPGDDAVDTRAEFFAIVDKLVSLGFLQYEFNPYGYPSASDVDPDVDHDEPLDCGHPVPVLTEEGYWAMEVLRECRDSQCPECTLFFGGDTTSVRESAFMTPEGDNSQQIEKNTTPENVGGSGMPDTDR